MPSQEKWDLGGGTRKAVSESSLPSLCFHHLITQTPPDYHKIVQRATSSRDQLCLAPMSLPRLLGQQGKRHTIHFKKVFLPYFVVVFVVVCEMLGRDITMNRKCSKETSLLHAVAQQASSVPTAELSIGMYDTTHMGTVISAGIKPV